MLITLYNYSSLRLPTPRRRAAGRTDAAPAPRKPAGGRRRRVPAVRGAALVAPRVGPRAGGGGARSRAAGAPTDDRKSPRVHPHRRGPRPRRGGAAGAAARRPTAAGRPVAGRRRRHRIFPATPRASGQPSGPTPTRTGRSSILNRGISRTRRSRAAPRSTRGGGRLVSPSRPSGAREVLRAHQ